MHYFQPVGAFIFLDAVISTKCTSGLKGFYVKISADHARKRSGLASPRKMVIRRLGRSPPPREQCVLSYRKTKSHHDKYSRPRMYAHLCESLWAAQLQIPLDTDTSTTADLSKDRTTCDAGCSAYSSELSLHQIQNSACPPFRPHQPGDLADEYDGGVCLPTAVTSASA